MKIRQCFVVMLTAWLMSLTFSHVAHAAVEVRDVRLWTAPDHTRVVVDLSRNTTYQVFGLKDPDRVVIDIDNGKLVQQSEILKEADPVIGSVRYGNSESGTLRLVFDVKEKVKLRSFLLKPMKGKPYRIVIDLLRNQDGEEAPVLRANDKRELIVAIDAGHGGEDPGAIGANGLQEKQVTLEVAKKIG